MERQDLFSVKDRIVLVTGASYGLGVRFAQVMALGGAKVACCARSMDKLQSVVKEIQRQGGNAIAVLMDMADRSSIRSAFDTIEKEFNGPVNVLINNAGMFDGASAERMTEEQWDTTFKVNTTGPFVAAQECARRLIAKKQPGSIINITSIAAHLTKPGRVNYSASKSALEAMTRSLALDWAKFGIRVNAISPGFLATPMSAPFEQTEEGRREIANLPIGRYARPDELDGPILLLASDASSYMSGSVITVDFAHSVCLFK